MTDHSGLIGLVRGKRTVRVIAYRLFYSLAKDLRYTVVNHVTVTENALHFSTLRSLASPNANPI